MKGSGREGKTETWNERTIDIVCLSQLSDMRLQELWHVFQSKNKHVTYIANNNNSNNNNANNHGREGACSQHLEQVGHMD